jgi:tetratricopeptide (TPR) repeat protein
MQCWMMLNDQDVSPETSSSNDDRPCDVDWPGGCAGARILGVLPGHLEALALARSLGDQRAIAQLLIGLGIVSRTTGDREAATAYFEESLAIHQRLDNRRGVAWSLHGLGQVAQDSGAYAQALELFAEALALARTIGDHENLVGLLYDLGCTLLHQHELADAAKQFGESAQFAYDLGLRQAVALNLNRLAIVRIQQGGVAQATRLLSAADIQWKQAASPYWGASERAEHERVIVTARAQLNEAAFAAAWAAGQAMTLEQAIAYALKA